MFTQDREFEMKTYFNKKASQSGRSMIEMLGVLAIVGILSASGIAGYSMAMQKHKGNQLIERVQLIATRARTIYKNGNYIGISNQNLIDSGKLSAKDLENPFGGNLTVKKSSTTPPHILIQAANGSIPIDTCVDILTTDWGGKGVISSISISIPSGGTAVNSLPLSVSDAINKCKFGDTTANKGISWQFM